MRLVSSAPVVRFFLVAVLALGLPAPASAAIARTGGVILKVWPATALIDAPVVVRVRTTSPRSLVTLEASAVIDGVPYYSWARYCSDDRGYVDTAHSSPLAGTYRGVDQMGLFWSMASRGLAGYSTPTLAPIRVTLRATEGKASAVVTLMRLRIASDVVRTAKTQGSPVGTLFSHASGKADAVVIVLGGSEGGVDENRAAIIASNGFDAFAMGYFGIDGLPKELANVPLEDVDQTIQWLDQRPDLRGLPIVLEGDSKGAEFALLAAAGKPAVCAVVAVSPSSQVFEGFSTEAGVQRSSWTLRGVPVPFANNPVPAAIKAQIKAARAMRVPISYRNQYLAIATPPQDESTIPVWNVRGPLFLVAGADDQLWPSDVFVNRIIDERKSHRVSYHDVALIFPNAGHQIDVPYMPTTGLANVIEPGFSVALGGTPSGYAKADATMWRQVLGFMRRACAARAG